MKLRLLFVVLCFFIGTTNTFSQGQIGLDIDGEAADDYSGYSVSISSDGNTVAIGAYRNGFNSGHVRIYENIGGTWSQIGQDIDGEAIYISPFSSGLD